ncbi:MAG: lysophospholipid acyltransferase family protein [Pirellulales bacterium]
MESNFSNPDAAAILWLALLALTAVAYGSAVYRRSPYSAWENVLYLPVYLWGRLLWHVHFTNDPPTELAHGAILVANHRSSVDPFFVQLAARRRVHWMVAREYCENPVSGPILKALQVIPTNRSGMDTASTKTAIRIAREGRLVGMFPEGRLNHTRDPLVSIRSGAALVAMRAGVPIIPIYILGSPYRRTVWSPLIMRADVEITFGCPIDPRSERADNTAITTETTGSADRVDETETSHTVDGSASANENGQSDSSSRAKNEGRDKKEDLVVAEKLILRWAGQILALAGSPDWPIKLAGRSRLNNSSNPNTTEEP